MISLAKFTIDDFEPLSSWINSGKELIQFSGNIFTFPIDKDQISRYLEDCNRVAFKVIDNDKVVGHAEIYHETQKRAKLCRILIGDPNLRGKGLGQQVISKLLNIAFEDMGYSVVHLNVYDWNMGAIKCYENCGFKINPTTTSDMTVGGEVWTALNMSINKEQWQA